MDFNEKEEVMELLNINKDEYDFIKNLDKQDYVFDATIVDNINGDLLTSNCVLILQKETLKIIKYKEKWCGNTLIFYRSISLVNSNITYNENIVTLQVSTASILLKFNQTDVMHQFYKDLTRKTNGQKQRRFL